MENLRNVNVLIQHVGVSNHRVHTHANFSSVLLLTFLRRGSTEEEAEEQVLEARIFPYLGFQGQNRVPIRLHGETLRVFILSRFIYSHCSSTLAFAQKLSF